MSAGTHADHGHHDHDHGHDHGHGADELGYHASLKGYLIGFILSVILTAIPFWMVMTKALPATATGIIILVFAAVQMIVHVIYFLHLDTKAQGGWNMLATIFTIIVLVILLSGSIWVMYHMNENMMPVDPQMMRNMP